MRIFVSIGVFVVVFLLATVGNIQFMTASIAAFAAMFACFAIMNMKSPLPSRQMFGDTVSDKWLQENNVREGSSGDR